MKAVVLHGVDDLRTIDVDDPVLVPGSVKIRVEFGGICGSDLHYWKHGGAGTSVVREPLVLGHEVAGVVAVVADDVTTVSVGDRVTVHPATFPTPCAVFGGPTLHLSPDVIHLGSAARLPHTAGAFSEFVVVPVGQVRILPGSVDTRTAAASEPLAVAVHALNRSGGVAGKSVMVNGAGPIGCLVVAGAVAAGAREIWVSDLTDGALDVATTLGAHHVVNIAGGQALPTNVDVVFEATGVPRAVKQCFSSVRPGGTIVQVGMLPQGEAAMDLALLVTREVSYHGSFRFLDEITDAVELLSSGLDIEPMLTHTFGIDDAPAAFATALDRNRASKVMLDFR
jgi:L-idonate 5-dehydrogenase